MGNAGWKFKRKLKMVAMNKFDYLKEREKLILIQEKIKFIEELKIAPTFSTKVIIENILGLK